MTDKADEAVTLALVLREVKDLRGDVAAHRAETEGLIEAWKTAGGVVKFVKLLSTVLAALGAVYLFFRHGIVPKAGG